MRKLLVSLGLGMAAFTPGLASAQEVEAVVKEEVIEEEAYDPNTGGIMLTGGFDIPCAYFFRGYNQEDSGFIFQPYATIGFNLSDTDALDVNFYTGIWNSFQSKKTLGEEGNPESWYEADLYAGLDFIWSKFTLGFVYTAYTYPGGAFDTIQEVGAKISYNDADFTKENLKLPVGLNPWVGVYVEVEDGNGTDDIYGELGIKPSIPIENTPFTVAFPAILGLSLDDYYTDSDGDNEFLGYVAVGVELSMPLPIPEKYGAWSLVTSLTYYQLCADSVQVANDGEDNAFVGRVGITFSY
jgi:hypothetical protein